MRAFLIARVSTEDQKDALPAQVYRLLEYAKRNTYDYELFEFQESAYSGTREQFRSIVDKIQNEAELVVVVFDKIDRYSRDSTSEEVRILDLLRKRGRIELHFPSDNLVINKDSPAMNKMQLGMGVMMAQYYSDAISDNVRRRFQQMRRDGLWTGKAPFGYKNVILKNGKRWINVNPFEGKIVKEIYAAYASGTDSLRSIRQMIIAKYGVRLTKSLLERIVKNPFYMGEMQVEGKHYAHNYDRLVTVELFEKVQEVRQGRGLKSTKYAGLPYPYRGLISCIDCGCAVTYEKRSRSTFTLTALKREANMVQPM